MHLVPVDAIAYTPAFATMSEAMACYQHPTASDHIADWSSNTAKPYVPYEGAIVTRDQARVLGLKRFFTAVSCIRGHFSERQTSSGMCLTCARVHVLVAYHADPDPVRQRVRDYAKKNRPRLNANRQVWLLANPGKGVEYAKRWRAKNRILWASYNHVRRARVAAAGGAYTPDDVETILKSQARKCAYCRKPLRGKFHIDHIKALAAGGSNDRRNIQCTCPRCNQSKGARAPEEFARSLGRLI